MEKDNNYKLEEEIEIDLRELAFQLLKKWKTIFFATLFCALLGLCSTIYFTTDTYVSKTSVYINSQQKEATNYSNLQTGSMMTKDYEVLVKGRTVLEKVIENLELNMTYKTLKSMVGVNVPDDTRIVEISVQSTDPYLSKDIADEIREISSESIVEIMGVAEVTTVEKANLPETSTGSGVKKNTLLGGMMGLVITCGIFTVMFIFNDTMRNQEDVERYLGLAVLGVIPMDESLEKEEKRRKKAKKYLKMLIM